MPESMAATEFEFVLPIGYSDAAGVLHRSGTMRLATVADELLPLRDPRVQQNAAYIVILVFSRVITRLGSLAQVDPKMIEGLFLADVQFLRRFYVQVNSVDAAIPGETRGLCPQLWQ